MSDDIDEQYRRASALDAGEPGSAARHNILQHAAALAAARAGRPEPGLDPAIQPSASARRRRRGWRWGAAGGALAAAGLAGLLVGPPLRTPTPAPQALAPQAPPSLGRAEAEVDRYPTAQQRLAPAPLASAMRAGPADPLHDALMGAVRQGNLTEVERLVALGADPEGHGADGTSPMQIAQAAGNDSIVEVLRRAQTGARPSSAQVPGRR